MSKNPRNESGKEFEGIVRDILKEHEIKGSVRRHEM